MVLRSPVLCLTDTDLADGVGLHGMTYEAAKLDAVIRETKTAVLDINVASTKFVTISLPLLPQLRWRVLQSSVWRTSSIWAPVSVR
jgi:hypothetical protein